MERAGEEGESKERDISSYVHRLVNHEALIVLQLGTFKTILRFDTVLALGMKH